jgi:hypothetical protein
MQMIFFVLDNPNRLDSLVDAWEKAGVRNVTILPSTGFHRHRLGRVPTRALFGDDVDEGNLTLMAIVPGEDAVQACLKATEGLLGDLKQPYSGVFASWTLNTVSGVSLPPQ